jgi:hypothetical protein
LAAAPRRRAYAIPLVARIRKNGDGKCTGYVTGSHHAFAFIEIALDQFVKRDLRFGQTRAGRYGNGGYLRG